MSLSSLVERLLPVTVGVGTGTVINAHGEQSPQTDLIIFDQGRQPQILAQTSFAIFPVETVIATVEVKTTVTLAQIDDARKKACAITDLSRDLDREVPLFLFGYNCGDSEAAVVKQIDDSREIAAACVLNPSIFGDARNSISSGLVQLHERVNGDRVSGSTISGERAAEFHHKYPAAAIRRYRPETVLTEPGRALLLFCEALLTSCSSIAGVDSAWLRAYLDATAFETYSAE